MVDIIESDFPAEFIGGYALAKLGITIAQLERESGCPEPFIAKVLERGPESVLDSKSRHDLLKVLYSKSGMNGASFWIRLEDSGFLSGNAKPETDPEQPKEKPQQQYQVVDRGDFYKAYYPTKKTVSHKPPRKAGKMSDSERQRRMLSVLHNEQNKKIGEPVKLTPAKVALIEHVRPEADLDKIVSNGLARTLIINGGNLRLLKTSSESVVSFKHNIRKWFADTLGITCDPVDPFQRRTYRWNAKTGRFDDLERQKETGFGKPEAGPTKGKNYLNNNAEDKSRDAQWQRASLLTVHNKQNKRIGEPIQLTPAKAALIERFRPEADLAKIVDSGHLRTAIINGEPRYVPKNSRKSVAEYNRDIRKWFADTLGITWDQVDPFTRRSYKWNPDAGRFDDLEKQTETDSVGALTSPTEDSHRGNGKPDTSKGGIMTDSERQRRTLSYVHDRQNKKIGEPVKLTPVKVALIEHFRPEADLDKIVSDASLRTAIINDDGSYILKNGSNNVGAYKHYIRKWFADTLGVTWEQINPFKRRSCKCDPKTGRFNDLEKKTETISVGEPEK